MFPGNMNTPDGVSASQLIIPLLVSGQSDVRASGFQHSCTQFRLQVSKTSLKHRMKCWLNALPTLQRPRVDFSRAIGLLGHFFKTLSLSFKMSPFVFHFYSKTKDVFLSLFFSSVIKTFSTPDVPGGET